MTEKDPIQQAEEALLEARQQMAAEATKMHAEMILLSSVVQKPMLMAQLLHRASQHGIDYMTGMVVAVGLTARNWGRIMADDLSLDFTRYIDEEVEALCEGDDAFAHYLMREVLLIEDTPRAEKLRQEMKEFAAQHEPLVWGRVVVHVVALYQELMQVLMDIKNGDYQEE